MAKTAAEAAELVADARLRLEAQIEVLARDTAPAIAQQLDVMANELQASGGAAELRQRELRAELDALEARAATIGDQVAAFTAAQTRVRRLEADLTAKRTERAGVDAQRQNVAVMSDRDRDRIIKKRDADVAENDKRIGGNQRILGMADQIRAAVTAVADAEAELAGLRAELTERQNERWKADTAVRAVERSIAALAPVEQRLDRSTRDAGLLASVPCGGAGEFAACQFLVDAKHAEAQIEDLKAKLEPKAALADQLSTGLKTVDLDSTRS
jgi:hypothetical protein